MQTDRLQPSPPLRSSGPRRWISGTCEGVLSDSLKMEISVRTTRAARNDAKTLLGKDWQQQSRKRKRPQGASTFATETENYWDSGMKQYLRIAVKFPPRSMLIRKKLPARFGMATNIVCGSPVPCRTSSVSGSPKARP